MGSNDGQIWCNEETQKRQRTRTNSSGVSSSPIDKIFKLIRPNSHLNDPSMPADVSKQSHDNPYLTDPAIILAISDTSSHDKDNQPKNIDLKSLLAEIPSNDEPKEKDLIQALLSDVGTRSREMSVECSGEQSDMDIASNSEEEVALFKNQGKAKKFHQKHNLHHCKKCKSDTSSPWVDPPCKATQDKLDYVPDTLTQDVVYIDSFVNRVYERFAGHTAHRRWLPVQPRVASPYSNNKVETGYRERLDFSVASYNVLSQKLLQDNRYLYRKIKSEYLEVGYRIPHIVAELHAYQSDIICFQEFDYQQVAMFKAVFGRHGYEGVFQPKPNVWGQSKDDGCFILYNANKFSLVCDNSVGLYREGERLLDKPNTCQVIVLQCKDEEKTELCIANTHLLYNPNRGDIKLAQLGVILNKIQNTTNAAKRCGSMPVIFCGDFNTCPNAPLYSLMKEGRLRYIGLDPRAVSGQKPGRSNGNFKKGLWDTAEFHEWGLVGRSCEDIMRGSTEEGNQQSTVQEVTKNPTESDKQCLRCNEQKSYNPGTLSHSFKFNSSYTHIEEDGLTQECTTYIQSDHRTVDYIWYTNDVQQEGHCVHGHTCNTHCSAPLLKLEARRRLLTGTEVKGMGKQPNHILGSDHQCLHAAFSLHVK